MSSTVAGRPWFAYAMLATSMTLVGSYVALSKPLVAAIPLFALAFLRFGIAAAAMLPWSRPQAGEAKLSPREQWLLFAMSFLGNFLFSICMLAGVSLSTATAAGVIMATLPASVAAGSRLFLGEHLSTRALAAIAAAVVGIVLLQFARPAEDTARTTTLIGNVLLFGAVLCEAAYVIIGKRLARVRSPLRVSALINLWGLALMAPFGLWQLSRFDLAQLTAGQWALLVFYALAASLFAVWLWMTGLRHVPANHAGVFTVALPISATLIGVLALGEAFTWLHAIALLLAASGVVLIASGRPAPASAPTASPGAQRLH
jgi:drug/metabolite transporter (DMT)-like permease